MIAAARQSGRGVALWRRKILRLLEFHTISSRSFRDALSRRSARLLRRLRTLKKLLHQKANQPEDCNQFHPWGSTAGRWKTFMNRKSRLTVRWGLKFGEISGERRRRMTHKALILRLL
jgi:hypothetical protein